jgi:glycosyltransferase involved in cell wall biosynthesis
MIIKDEARSLRGLLDAVAPHHIDAYTIIDTGSTDGSQSIIREAMVGVPGKLYELPFKGYKDSRNEALELDRENGTEFQIVLSGDEYLRDPQKLREYLETQRPGPDGLTGTPEKPDIHFIRLVLDSGIEYQPRIFRTGSPWKYDDFGLGVHEVPVHPVKGAPVGAFAGAHIDHDVSDPIGRMDHIWENHIPKLEEAHEKDPKNVRAIEFLAQSYESFLPHMEGDELTQTARRCLDLYHRRFALPFEHPEQKNFFMMRYINDARLSGVFKPEELFIMVDELYKADSTRPETALLRAVIASTCTTKLASEVYTLAKEAAAVGEEVRLKGGLNNSAPLDMSTEWKAHRLAAVAAKQLAGKHDEYKTLVREHIKNGLALGGSWVLFKDILGPDATPEQLETLG